MPRKTDDPRQGEPGPRYGWYALSVLVLVYALNFIDRQMLTILAGDIKRDLHVSDSEFGFLYGTAFGVFYALFGIPLGKLADRWPRIRLLTIGLTLWSAMTVLSGLARGFGQLGLARIGVGVGEATAGPCGYSLLSDYFPPRRRATAIAIFSSGIYLGGGLALSLGTALAHAWDSGFAAGHRPLGLAGWQAAFLAVGLPGLVLAQWVRSLREPRRGRFDEAAPVESMGSAQALRLFLADVMTIVPPFTLVAAARRGGRALIANGIALAIVVACAAGLSRLVGDSLQWIVLGVGVYAVASWAQALATGDAEAFAAIWRSRAVMGVNVGYGLVCALAYALTAFGPLYAIERFAAPAAQVALIVGGGGAAGGVLGVIAGGALADRLGADGHHARRIVVIMGALVLAVPIAVLMLTTPLRDVFYLTVFPFWFVLSSALGSASGTIVNIVPARIRATATAAFFLGATMLGLALGPYVAGRLSGALHSLQGALVAMLAVVPFALVALALAFRDQRRRDLTAC